MMLLRKIAGVLLASAAFLAAARPAQGIIEFPDPGRDVLNFPAQSPADGYQYEGEFGKFMGTAIAPEYFITAKHLGVTQVGSTFTLSDGTKYVTDSVQTDGDVAIWHVTTKFTRYAPIDTQPGSDVGQDFVAYGRGYTRGAAITVATGPDMGLKGWQWGSYDGSVSRGTGTIDGTTSVSGYGQEITWTFNPNSSQLSNADSGGGLFIKRNGQYVLAGINDLVDAGPYSSTGPEGPFVAGSIFNQSGLYLHNPQGPPELLSDTGGTQSYDLQVAANLGFILQVTGVPEPSGLALMAAGLLGLGLAGRRRRRGRRSAA